MIKKCQVENSLEINNAVICFEAIKLLKINYKTKKVYFNSQELEGKEQTIAESASSSNLSVMTPSSDAADQASFDSAETNKTEPSASESQYV